MAHRSGLLASALLRLVWATGLSLLASAVWADGAAILRCRQVAEPAQRLSCYEAIVVATPAVVSAPPPPSPPPAQSGPERFGMETRTALANAPDRMESVILGRLLGWGPNDTFTLANGQIWQVADESRGVLVANDPKVVVRRGAMGAFYLEIAGTNRSPRVRRLQ